MFTTLLEGPKKGERGREEMFFCIIILPLLINFTVTMAERELSPLTITISTKIRFRTMWYIVTCIYFIKFWCVLMSKKDPQTNEQK